MMGVGGRGAEAPVLLEDTLSYCWRTGRGGPRPTMILVIYIPEVPLDKLRCISTIKKCLFFCIVFDFNKILTLKNEKYFSFFSLNRIFTVPLNKVRCISTIKKNGVFFVLCSICSTFAEAYIKNTLYK